MGSCLYTPTQNLQDKTLWLTSSLQKPRASAVNRAPRANL